MKKEYVSLAELIDKGEFDKDTFWKKFAELQQKRHNGLKYKIDATLGTILAPGANIVFLIEAVTTEAKKVLKEMGLRCRRSEVKNFMFVWCTTDTTQAISLPAEYLETYF